MANFWQPAALVGTRRSAAVKHRRCRGRYERRGWGEQAFVAEARGCVPPHFHVTSRAPSTLRRLPCRPVRCYSRAFQSAHPLPIRRHLSNDRRRERDDARRVSGQLQVRPDDSHRRGALAAVAARHGGSENRTPVVRGGRPGRLERGRGRAVVGGGARASCAVHLVQRHRHSHVLRRLREAVAVAGRVVPH